MREITIKDIAEASGVSYATVSRTLNNLNGVKKETRERIIKAAQELGYRPNSQARALKTNRTNTIALMVPDISNPFFSDIALSVNDYAFPRGYTTVLCSSGWDEEVEHRQLLQLLDQRVDGIIYKPTNDVLEELELFGTNSIVVSHLPGAFYDYIEVNNQRGGELAAAHLIAGGYRRIGFVGGSRNSLSNRMRLEGLTAEIRKSGLIVDETLFRFGPFSTESGYALTAELMSMKNPPDALFCGNDLIALGALQYLAENGIRVPEEVGVIGFDDIYISSLPQIQLSTVSVSRKEMGETAAEILIRKIEKGEEAERVQHIILEPTLVPRRSTRE